MPLRRLKGGTCLSQRWLWIKSDLHICITVYVFFKAGFSLNWEISDPEASVRQV